MVSHTLILQVGETQMAVSSQISSVRIIFQITKTYIQINLVGLILAYKSLYKLTAEYAKLPLIPAYLDPSLRNYDFVYGANFASTGSGALVETNAGFVCYPNYVFYHYKKEWILISIHSIYILNFLIDKWML